MSWYGEGLRFACRRCGNCCSGKGSYVQVTDREIEALALATGMSIASFRERHTTTTQGMLVLLDRGDGACEWLDRDDAGTTSCRVQDAKPDQCRSYPFWPRLLKHRGAWEAEGVSCAGIGAGETLTPEEVERRAGIDRLLERLDVLCEELDADVEALAPVCELSGRCCDFPTAGHRLFASRLEAERFTRGVDLTGWDPATGLCPAWKDRRCTAREHRPMGCRSYFCDPAYADAMPDITERSITRLKWLHEKHGLTWDYRDWIEHLATIQRERAEPSADERG